MESYICNSCESEFFIESVRDVLYCPVCGENDLLSEKEEWIDENEGELFDEE